MNIVFKKVFLLSSFTIIFFMTSCMKKVDKESVFISQPVFQIGQTVQPGNISGAIKGTILAGKSYTIVGDVTVNVGDTLLMQAGSTICVSGVYNIIVRGTFLSLGTQASPNWITMCGNTKVDNSSEFPSNDPAYTKNWCGISCDTTCNLLVIKWTHIEYTGAAFVTQPVAALSAGNAAYTIFFNNPNGVFVLEDSWLYGCVDDAVRIEGGKIQLMRNTLEKCGYTGGDLFNAKNGTVGNMAYNMIIGGNTNGTKASNKGGIAAETNVYMYNNTYVNCGYRRSTAGRGGSIDYEQGAEGQAYNNLIVNCKYGLRVVQNPAADTANLFYGNTFYYGDSLSVTDQFYPTTYVTKPELTDIPNPTTYLPNPYALGEVYNGAPLIGQNNPMFVNYPLPQPLLVPLSQISYTGVTPNYNSPNSSPTPYNFRLQSNSPCIGRGYTGFQPLQVVPVSANFGATAITPPSADIGAYPLNGSGNQH
jgi:hypothetical protein